MAAIVVSNKALQIGHRLNSQLPVITGTIGLQKRDASTNLATYRRGRGGRSSFSGTVATVLGASGSLGGYVVNRLGKVGSQVVIPYRGDTSSVDRFRLCGDLGQILFSNFHLRDDDSLRRAMKYSNVVINLIGRDWETRNFSFYDVHTEGARRVARIAKEMGVKKLIHFSSLNASPNPQQIFVKGGSHFLRSKYEGELAVREEFPEAVIFRPADMFGPEDRFTITYTNYWRRAHGVIPLWKKGDATIKQPVFVADVAEGVLQAINDPDVISKTIEAVGPYRYYLADLVDFFYRALRFRNVPRYPITPLFQLKARIMGMAPNNPIFNLDKLDKDHVTDVLTDCLTLEDLGVQLTRIEDRVIFDLKPFRVNAYYDENLGEFRDPPKPPIVPPELEMKN
ncbi:NADH dehydrogenase [ubiquinone] 1 alpha subcomplex subunit 9, mitochondrial [Patella vulgata]|uniref:NADH dehydrogenase [ubiquinone] 1 alpha subcomplex subunit 9, mitochondrial n=1 Tax=Patella vulgata TaxID=6465 RepID=UPI00217F915D|nr:NADH dehydrogenase [ubiquinone] 1 alpha subcomplex subunit 9, mitochondrial [Patella vulgata]XP_050404792.1 NADH dehydrogenase [ubiquinone] 1 alpha subcomplex subunit 9, mitochondrial [Patella vulgata]